LASVGTEWARIAGAGTIIRASACRTLNTIAWLTDLDSASKDERVDASTDVGLIVRIGLVPSSRRNVGKHNGSISLGNGASSENSPIAGDLPRVSTTRVGIHLYSIDVNQQISTNIVIVIALIVAERLVRESEVSVGLEGGGHGQRAIASIGSIANRYLAEGQVTPCQYNSRIRRVAARFGRVTGRRRAVCQRDALA